MGAIETVEQAQLTERPPMKSGDTVRVHVKVREGDKERIQIFEGIVIGMHRGGLRSSFTVRKVSFGQGVERIFPLHSPTIAKVDVVRSAQGTAIQAVLADLIGGRSRLLAEVEHGDARVLQIDVPEDVPARRLKEMHAPVFAIVGAIQRAGKTIIPRGDDEVKGGDRIVVFCDAASEPTARTFFERGIGEA